MMTCELQPQGTFKVGSVYLFGVFSSGFSFGFYNGFHDGFYDGFLDVCV